MRQTPFDGLFGAKFDILKPRWLLTPAPKKAALCIACQNPSVGADLPRKHQRSGKFSMCPRVFPLKTGEDPSRIDFSCSTAGSPAMFASKG